MEIRHKDFLLERWRAGRKKPISPWKLSLIVSLAVTACLALLNSTGGFQILEWGIFDQYFRLRPAEETDSRLLIITIDEPDIARLQQWPLSDENLAKVLAQVDRYDPRVIGLDIYRDFPIPPGTAALEKVFRNTPNLIGVEKLGNTPVEAAPILAEQDQVAMADIVMDNDGTVRRALLSARVGNEVRYTLGAALALQYLREEGITLETAAPSNLSRLGAVKFPPLQDDDGAYVNADIRGHQLLLNFRGPDNAFDAISITDVLEGRLPEALVRDRIILIGSIAPSLNDFVYTPYNTSTMTQTAQSPGVTIHAHTASQILSAVLDGRSLIQTWPTAAEWGWTFLWCSLGSGIILIPVWRGHNSLISLVSTGIPILSLSAALMIINGLWFLNGWWIPSIPAALGIIISATVSLTTKDSTKLVRDIEIDNPVNLEHSRFTTTQCSLSKRITSQASTNLLSQTSGYRSIFISYRRIDSKDITRKIYDLLADHFGHVRVFRDLDSIPAGVTFKEYIEQELSQCQILLAVIGPMWLQVTDKEGRRRLDDPKDWVRLEIEFALERGIPVIPLLINDTKMPKADELPGSLKKLSTRHAARVRHTFQLKHRDVTRLIYDIESLLLKLALSVRV